MLGIFVYLYLGELLLRTSFGQYRTSLAPDTIMIMYIFTISLFILSIVIISKTSFNIHTKITILIILSTPLILYSYLHLSKKIGYFKKYTRANNTKIHNSKIYTTCQWINLSQPKEKYEN